GDGDDRGGLSNDQSFEGDHVAGAGLDGQVTVRQMPDLLPPAAFAVDELHPLLIRRRITRRWRLFVRHKPLNCKVQGEISPKDGPSHRGDNRAACSFTVSCRSQPCSPTPLSRFSGG